MKIKENEFEKNIIKAREVPKAMIFNFFCKKADYH